MFNVFQNIYTLAGSNQSFNVEPTDTILTLKTTLQESVGVDVAMIKLIYGGKSLVDENTIEASGITAGNILHMVM